MFTTLSFITLLLISKVLKTTPDIDHTLVIMALLASLSMAKSFVDRVLISLTLLMLFNIVYKTIHMGVRSISVKDEMIIKTEPHPEPDMGVKDESSRPMKLEVMKDDDPPDRQTSETAKQMSVYRATEGASVQTTLSKEDDWMSDAASDTTVNQDLDQTAEKPISRLTTRKEKKFGNRKSNSFDHPLYKGKHGTSAQSSVPNVSRLPTKNRHTWSLGMPHTPIKRVRDLNTGERSQHLQIWPV